MTEERAPYDPTDPVTRLKLLGFRDSYRCPGMLYEMQIRDVKVTASVDFRHLNFIALQVTDGNMSEMEVGIPVSAPLGAFAEAIARITNHFFPETIDWDDLWAWASLELLKTERPSVFAHRRDLRRALKALKGRLPNGPLADARLDFDGRSKTSETSYLRLQIGDIAEAVPASGVWVGTIWVKTPALLGCLRRRFMGQHIRVGLIASDGDRHGNWLRVGNSEIRAWWDAGPDGDAGAGRKLLMPPTGMPG